MTLTLRAEMSGAWGLKVKTLPVTYMYTCAHTRTHTSLHACVHTYAAMIWCSFLQLRACKGMGRSITYVLHSRARGLMEYGFEDREAKGQDHLKAAGIEDGIEDGVRVLPFPSVPRPL